MSIFKPLSDSVGTAAGVGGPLFGLVAGSLGFEAGATVTLALGSVSLLLFVGVALGCFYVFYNNSKAEYLKLKTKTTAYLTEFIENFLSQRNKSIEDFKEHPLQYHLLQLIQTKYPSLLKEYPNHDQQIVERIIDEFIASAALKKLVPAPPISALAPVFFVSTVAVFGAVAGSSAGLMGIAVGLGLLSGFAAVPGLGLTMLVLAAIAGFTLACYTTRETIEKNQQTKVYKNFKAFNRRVETFEPTADRELSFSASEEEDSFSTKLHFFDDSRDNDRNPISLIPGADTGITMPSQTQAR